MWFDEELFEEIEGVVDWEPKYDYSIGIQNDMQNKMVKHIMGADTIKPIKEYRDLNRTDEYPVVDKKDWTKIVNKQMNKKYEIYLSSMDLSKGVIFIIINKKTKEEIRLIYSKENGFKMPVYPKKPIDKLLNDFCKDVIQDIVYKTVWRIAIR